MWVSKHLGLVGPPGFSIPPRHKETAEQGKGSEGNLEKGVVVGPREHVNAATPK